jgi:protein-arginine kinase activator protein McsA
VHYVAHHRSEVPQQQLAKIAAFTFGEVEPTYRELASPEPILGELPMEVRQALKELQTQIEALTRERKAAVAEQDFERAGRLRDQADQLKTKKEAFTRESRTRYVVEHFDTIADPSIKMRWGVILFYEEAASVEIVEFLRTILESKEQCKTLSERLGPRFDDFIEKLKVYEVKENKVPAETSQVLKEMAAQIEALTQEKEVAVAERDFERAARLRDQADQLKKRVNVHEAKEKK